MSAVLEGQAGGRFVEDVHGLTRRALRQLGGQLHALGLAAAEVRGRLPKADVTQTHVVHGFELFTNSRNVLEILHGL